jgi:hypothetical protein
LVCSISTEGEILLGQSFSLFDNLGRLVPGCSKYPFLEDDKNNTLFLGRTSGWSAIISDRRKLTRSQAFLPFFVSICNQLESQTRTLPGDIYSTRALSKQFVSVFSSFAALAFIWGLSVAHTSSLIEKRTGAICPVAVWERITPLAQLTTSCFDALIIQKIARLRHNHEARSTVLESLSTSFLGSAGVLAFLALWSSLGRINFRWNVLLAYHSMGDLLLDSSVIVAAIMASIYLLGIFHPALVALAINESSLLIHIQAGILDKTSIRAWAGLWGCVTSTAVFFGLGVLLLYTAFRSPIYAVEWHFPQIRRYRGFASLVVLFMAASQVIWLRPSISQLNRELISHVIAKSRTESAHWIQSAAQSKTLREATREYQKRYGIPPPPHFDKWYDYAVSVHSPIIDEFSQIHSDLFPYWGMPPALIRDRTVHLLEHPMLSFGGLAIEHGKIRISPHIHGTHKWMMDAIETMVEPFAQWLPDMQLAFNLDDECRISVPFQQMKAYQTEAKRSRLRMTKNSHFSGFDQEKRMQWPNSHLDEENGKRLWKLKSKWFQNWSKSPIFDNWISPTCPPDTPINKVHWWNRKAECPDCPAPHMTNGVIANWTLAGNLCHQPDLAYLHGFLYSPSAMIASHTLFPVFSQSRAQNFADILYPSPWNFGDKVIYKKDKDIPWYSKLNSVFWRGASSDGYASHGAWQTFLRTRFVYMSTHLPSYIAKQAIILARGIIQTNRAGRSPNGPQLPALYSIDNDIISVNVSFVGVFRRCDERDCAAEHNIFYGSPSTESAPSLDFEEHWYHRHLVDLDGAAFSGRFLPFLRSASLPYRAALFRTWWEERVHPWRHYVPLDVRLHELWDLVAYFGGKSGNEEAQEIAQEGSDWAQKALRKEDMQVYMFRLLLEWGRIVNDHREELGFVEKQQVESTGDMIL